MHQPVLLEAVLDRLRPSPGETHVDCTVGLGGHAARILSRLGPTGLLIGIDRDAEALELARPRLAAVGFPFRLVQGVYSRVADILKSLGLRPEGTVDGLLLDLGVSSLQLDRAERGFSFLHDGPLDMRMSRGEGEAALELIEKASLEEIERVLREYGEEPAARRIAQAIDAARRKGGLRTTSQLAGVVEQVVPRRGKKIHPATRTFQGIRIAVNGELEHLRVVLQTVDRLLRPGGRAVVLSYHSLEDRIVKESFRQGVSEGFFRWVLPNPERPSPEETDRNQRSRSARLRSVVRVVRGIP